MSNLPTNYPEVLQIMKTYIHETRYQTLKNINKGLISLYWNMGKTISEKVKREVWGFSAIKILSEDLQAEFPGINGFSVPNLRKMRQFYDTYKDNEIQAKMILEVGWVHNILIMQKTKNEKEREFYLKMTSQEGWSRGDLLNKIENHEYKSYLQNQTNFDRTLPIEKLSKLSWDIKDEYNFGFTPLKEESSEKEIEDSLVQNIVKFLAEMGGEFCFMGRQYKVVVEQKEFFIDLLFYHRKLKSMVAIELKSSEFKFEYTGQMAGYLAILDDKVKHEDENPSIGIIICKSKNRAIVEYALSRTNSPMGISTFKYKELPKSVAKYLPNEVELKKRLR